MGAGAQSWRWQDKKKQRVGNAAPSPGRAGVVKDDRKSVYVRNLPFRAAEEDLDSFFSQVGRVVDVRRGANSEGAFSVSRRAQQSTGMCVLGAPASCRAAGC